MYKSISPPPHLSQYCQLDASGLFELEAYLTLRDPLSGRINIRRCKHQWKFGSHTLLDFRPLNPFISLIASFTSSGMSFFLSFFDGRPLLFNFGDS